MTNLPVDSLGLVVEDQQPTREWLIGVLEAALPVRAHGVGDLAAARAWLAGLAIDGGERLRIVLIDLGLPDGHGTELIREVRGAFPAAVPVVVTAADDDANLLEALAAGAEGYLLKYHDVATMTARLRCIEQGEPPLSPSVARRMLAHFQRSPSGDSEERLTPREVDVLRLIGRGSRVAEAAAHLSLTEQTVATYVKIIYRKLRISSRAEAALAAARRGLI